LKNLISTRAFAFGGTTLFPLQPAGLVALRKAKQMPSDHPAAPCAETGGFQAFGADRFRNAADPAQPFAATKLFATTIPATFLSSISPVGG